MPINKCYEFECDNENCDALIDVGHFLSMGCETITQAKAEARRWGWKVTKDACLCKKCTELALYGITEEEV